jgi:hypothetical protein
MGSHMRDYLSRTFLEVGNGFHFASPPPTDIADLAYLKSGDWQEVLACVLANLQQGNFSVATVPGHLLETIDAPGLWVACTNLIGFAAPMSEVRHCVQNMSSKVSSGLRFYLCKAAMASGGVWAVQAILGAYPVTSDPDTRRFLAHALSWLLEEEPGPIWDGPDMLETPADNLPPHEEPEAFPDVEGYMAMVRERVSAWLQGTAPGDASIVAEGQVLQIGEVARRLYERVRRGERGDRIEKGRMLFEAMTGVDCRTFFDQNGTVQPLAAAAILEEFLESGEAGKYEPGVRYFFGRPIPD